MARKTSRKGTAKSPTSIITIIVIALIVLVFGSDYFKEEVNFNFGNKASEPSVHFIDVGQGMSTLIQSGEKGILIDSGEKEYSTKVISYINSCKIKELEYVIASHPHTDHIGGLSDIIKSVKTNNIIMPRLAEFNTPTTRTYENLLKTVKSEGIKAIAAKPGNSYTVDNVKFDILAPNEQTKDLNNMSVVCKVTAYSTTFMMLADAEKPELKTILNKNFDLSCSIIQMGHHGSSTSLEKDFLKKVNPSVAVISCGKNNSYGHPHKETIEYLKDYKIENYRTDKNGTVIITCYENGYKIKTEKG